jgi:hypothetical protein
MMMADHVPWSDPGPCPTCGGEARNRTAEGEVEWDPVRIDPTDVEEALRVAEGPISLIRDSLDMLEALEDEAASNLATDTRRLLKLWDRFKEIGQTRVERARAALAESEHPHE